MSNVIKVRPKIVELDAMRFTLGTTTKREILDFCPDADIGVKVNGWLSEDELLDSTDLQWIIISGKGGEVAGYLRDGDWLLKGVTGRYFIREDDEYRQTYEVIE